MTIESNHGNTNTFRPVGLNIELLRNSGMKSSQDKQTKLHFAHKIRGIQSRLFAYIHSLVRDWNDSEDLFQQTTMILWKKFSDYDSDRDFFAWACGIARFEVANFLRKDSRQRLHFTDELNLLLLETYSAQEESEMESRREALANCVQKLKPQERQLLTDCYADTDGVQQVADRDRRSPQSVYNSLRRIRHILFQCVTRTMQDG